MCLFSVAYQTVPDCPVFVFANREESPDRPSSVPAIRNTNSAHGVWIGGTDLRAGGTWLGINRAGVIVAVTNRKKSHVPQQPKSRGLLCREILEQGPIEMAEAEFHRQWNTEPFAGFNLVLISAERGWIFSAGDRLEIQPLAPGEHAITNRDWNDPDDPRITRVRGLMRAIQQSGPSVEDWIDQSKRICGLGEDAGGDAVCIPCTKGWGTVSSSVIALTKDRGESRYLHAAGSPATTGFEDCSPLLRALLKAPA